LTKKRNAYHPTKHITTNVKKFFKFSIIAILGAFFGAFVSAPALGAIVFSGLSLFSGKAPEGAALGPDVSTLASAFVEFGGKIFTKQVNEWVVDPFIDVYKSVKTPQVLPKLSAVGNPRPYRAQDDNVDGTKFTDRTLTVYQSKWDYEIDPEAFRNKYLATKEEVPFYEHIINQVAKEYLSQIYLNTLYLGSYNAAGSTAAAIATGWGTTIAAEITGLTLTPIATGALATTDAVTKVELFVTALPSWMKERQAVIFCSYATFEKYRAHYRTLNGYGFNPLNGSYKIDGYPNMELKPVAWMGTSARLIATVPGNLIIGTDGDAVQIAATARRNIIEVRQMMPVGMQIADLEAIYVNDQA
jgi:hypothetical protein